MNWILIAPEILLATYGTAILLVGMVLFSARQRRNMPLVTAGFMGVLLIWMLARISVDQLFMTTYIVDPYSSFFKVVILISAIIILLAGRNWIKSLGRYQLEFCSVVSFAVLGMFIISSAADLITAYVGLELMAITFVIMTGFALGNTLSSEAAMKYLMQNAVSSAILLYGMSLVYGSTHSLQISDIAVHIAGTTFADGGMTPALIVGCLMMFVGFMFKVAAVPFHAWSPDVYEGSPTTVTAFMSVASKSAAIALLLRFFFTGFEGAWATWGVILYVVILLTMFIGNVVAIPQTNIKRMLAYSGIGHAGYILLGLLAWTDLGVAAILFYLFIYVFANLGAFIVAIVYEEQTGSTEIKDYTGMAQRSPLLAATMLVSLLALAGLPPLSGFVGKFFLFAAAIEQGYIWLSVFGLVMSVVSLYYYLIVLKVMYIGDIVDENIVIVPKIAKGLMYISIIVTIVLGIYPAIIYDWALSAAQLFVR